jgi:type I restriction enzyme S subunit
MKRPQWPVVRLGDIAEFRNGVNYNKSNFGEGLKVINVKDFQDRLIADLSDLEEINPDGLIRDECLIRDGDILFVRSNGNRDLIGRSMLVNGVKEPISHSAFSIKARFTSSDVFPRFYAYLFRTALIRTELSNRGGGTNISNLNQDILNGLEVPKPSLPTQRKIASTLSVYDDLIENNSHRIALLEQMAHALYRECFVDFRFPGHGTAKVVNSPLGKIPDGCAIVPLSDKLSVLETGSRPKGGVGEIKEGMPSIGAENIMGAGIYDFSKTKYVPVEFFEGMRQGILSDRDVLVYKDGGKPGYFIPHISFVGRGFPFSKMVINSHVYRLRAIPPITQEFLYYHLTSEEMLQWMHLHGSGAAIPSIARKDLQRLPLVVPPADLIARFTEFAEPALSEILVLARKTHNLRQTRDLLLPKLISGELDVQDMDIDTGEAVTE